MKSVDIMGTGVEFMGGGVELMGNDVQIMGPVDIMGLGHDAPSWRSEHPVLAGIWGLVSAAGAGMGAYHGYKRNNESIGWAIGWFLLGGLFPVITIPVSFAQGFGKLRRK